MKLADLHVIVVGGAAAGAGCALLLGRAGARVTLLEKVADPRAIGAGIGLAENGLAVLESVGVLPALQRDARPVPSPTIVDGRGRVLLAMPGPPPRVLMVRRSVLQRVLLDAVAVEPRIERRFGAEVIGSEPDGRVRVSYDGLVHELAADLVIGADGVHSRIRAGGDHGARVSRPGISYVRTLVAGDLARHEEAWTAEGLFGSFAVDGGTYLYASAGGPAVRRALAAHDLEGFRTAWARAYAPAAELLAGVARWEDLLLNQVIRVDCRRWFDQRQVLVGDAAHAMAPNLGQGANSAFVDAAVLLDELRAHAELPIALAAYQERRQGAVRKVAQASARLGSLAEVTNPVGRWLRDRVLMPVIARLSTADTTSTVLQEPTERLLAIGRA